MRFKKRFFSSLFIVAMIFNFFVPSRVFAEAVIDSLDYDFGVDFLGDSLYEAYLNDYIESMRYYFKEEVGEEYTDELFNSYLKESSKSYFQNDYESLYDDFLHDYFIDNLDGKPIEYYSEYHEELLDKYLELYYRSNYISFLIDSGILGQFDITGNDNDIGTTYDNYGYYSIFKLGDNEVSFGEDIYDFNALMYTDFSNNGFVYSKPGVGKFSIKAVNKDANTVVVTYSITNNSGVGTNFAISGLADVELGENDDAAISKTNSSFMITQDSMDYLSSYGAQFKILLEPNASTTYVGPYATEIEDSYDYYYYHGFENSNVQYYTSNDDVDTALTYSWQGYIENGETKSFDAIFTLGVADTFDINFYPNAVNESKSDPIVVNTLGGGAFKSPVIDLPKELGYNNKWYSLDGSISYYPDAWVVAPSSPIDFYLAKRENTVIPYSESSSNYGNAVVIKNDNLVNSFSKDASDSYDDVKIILDVNEIDSSLVGDEKNLIDSKVSDGFSIGSYLDIDLYKLINNEDKISVSETDSAIKIKLNLPSSLINYDRTIKRDYEIIRVHDGVSEVIPASYDYNTNELSFETNKFSTYAIAYSDSLKPSIDNPSTFDNISISISLLSISLLGFISIGLYNKKKVNY